MNVLKSEIQPRAAEFQANAAAMRALVEDLRAKAGEVSLGGGQAARDKHVARGKLLPRDRVDRLPENDAHALGIARRIVSHLNREKPAGPPVAEVEEPRYDPAELYGILPTDTRKPYDVREIIARIVDGSRFDEFKPRYGATLVDRKST